LKDRFIGMRRVLISANSTWNIENFRLPLVRALIRKGCEVTTVSADEHGIALDGAPLRHRTAKMHPSTINPAMDVAYAARLFKILTEEKPDLYLSFTIKPNIYGCTLCRMLKVPAIPNVTGLGTSFLGSAALRRTVSAMYRAAFAGAARVFFQNRDDKNLFIEEKLVDSGRTRVIPGSGVDLEHFSRAELPANLHFLMVSRLLRDKGVREYVDAARLLKEELPDARFSLVGDVDLKNPSSVRRSEVEGWTREGVVSCCGSSADVRASIREATAVVLPSYREGLPRSLLEAAAMGRPLIGTDVPGCRDLVRDGVTGFLCKARDARSLAEAMMRLATASHEERSLMGARARAMAEEEFDEKFVVQAYLDAMAELSPGRDVAPAAIALAPRVTSRDL
jgi:glycosyltransferase involved in cell wall biosynthesis